MRFGGRVTRDAGLFSLATNLSYDSVRVVDDVDTAIFRRIS